MIAPGIAAAAVAVFGIGSALLAHASTRFVRTQSPDALATSFLASSLTVYGHLMIVTPVGLAAYFLSGSEVWVFLIGFLFSLGGLVIVAPTRAKMERWEAKLRDGGSEISLLESLKPDGQT